MMLAMMLAMLLAMALLCRHHSPASLLLSLLLQKRKKASHPKVSEEIQAADSEHRHRHRPAPQ
jgi:hypothetical protein